MCYFVLLVTTEPTKHICSLLTCRAFATLCLCYLSPSKPTKHNCPLLTYTELLLLSVTCVHQNHQPHLSPAYMYRACATLCHQTHQAQLSTIYCLLPVPKTTESTRCVGVNFAKSIDCFKKYLHLNGCFL